MKYLLDVNVLIAYGFRKHGFHDRVSAWVSSCKGDRFLTCSITELGFVRILGNVGAYGIDVVHARLLLMDWNWPPPMERSSPHWTNKFLAPTWFRRRWAVIGSGFPGLGSKTWGPRTLPANALLAF
jgi:predicted nucleic acid-binding protein